MELLSVRTLIRWALALEKIPVPAFPWILAWVDLVGNERLNKMLSANCARRHHI
jgi:hypothetical protein